MKLLLTFIAFASSAAAQTPLSAIDWLTESINDPPVFTVPPESTTIVPSPFGDISIDVTIDQESLDAIGLLAPSVSGFSANIWGNMPASQVERAIMSFNTTGTPEARNLFRRLLVAQANPPEFIVTDGRIFNARLDRLFSLGALDASEAMLSLVNEFNPSVFQRMFDTAILTERTTKTCAMLKNTPNLSNDLSTRIYCLARGGDWNAAAITLSLGASIGAIERPREEMLIRFLDPELFEGEPDPAVPEPLEVMDFILREAVLLPRPTGHLPLPYYYRDIGLRAPLRARMEASERLVRAGSLPSNLLFASYRTGQAASSGGIWGRANAVQMLDMALYDGDNAKLAKAVDEIYTVMADADLLVALADEFGDALANISYTPELAPALNQIIDILLLSGLPAEIWADHAVIDDKQQLAMALVSRSPLPDDPAASTIVKEIAAGFSNNMPDSPSTALLMMMLDDGQQAPAILGALALLSSGSQGDPVDLHSGIYTLIEAGQPDVARKIAVQILLLPNEV